jgi:hypothetical protein
MVDDIAGLDGFHEARNRALLNNMPGSLAQFVRPAAIHSHALNIANTDDQDTYIVAAIPIVGKLDQPARGMIQIPSAARDGRHLRAFHGAVQSIRTKQKNIPGQELMLIHLCSSKQVMPQGPDQHVTRI